MPTHPVVSKDRIARDLPGGRPRVGRRLSVLHFLVAIAVLPTLALPLLAGQLALERQRDAAAAGRIERELLAIRDLDRLRTAISQEVTAGSLALTAGQLRIPVALFSGQLNLSTSSPTQAKTETDAELTRLTGRPDLSGTLSAVRTELTRVRALVDSAMASGSVGLADLPEISLAYAGLGDRVSEAEKRIAQEVASGSAGMTSPELLRAASALQEIAPIVVSGSRRVALYYVAMLAPTADWPDLVRRLQVEDADYRRRTAELSTVLTTPLARTWTAMEKDAGFTTFDAAVATARPSALISVIRQAHGSISGIDIGKAMSLLPVAQAGTHVLKGLSDYLEEAVTGAVAIARADADDARRRAAISLSFTAAVLLGTVVALVLIGGLLRERLRELALGAQRLSAGHLEAIPVRGPHELASTSEAINAAVASLRAVEAKAELLASGDLSSPELERQVPGPLGAAVHASVARIVAAVRDRERLQRELAHQASHDGLTELANRAELDRALERALARARRNGTCVSALFLDLDDFKACNDRLGHAAGDHVLRAVADRLRSSVRGGDLVGRWGGDEFVVVVETAQTEPELIDLGERLVAELARPIEYHGQLVQVGASAGLSTSEAGRVGADQLLSEADTAAYRAKAAGGNVLVSYDTQLRSRAEARRELHAGVADALRQGDLVLHYQPVVDLATSRLRGFEALLRWDRPGTGLVLPADFLPAVEGTELIVEIGRWVLDTAARELVGWSEQEPLGELEISVNLSGYHVLQACVVDDVRAALEGSGLAANRLIVEITETVPIDSPQAVDHLRQLSGLGIRLALDDFGAGGTSISQLLRLPISIVKLDRSLVAGLARAPQVQGARPIAHLMIEMAHRLGLSVVAEGVEHRDWLAALTGAMAGGPSGDVCDQGQGFFFSHPLPAPQARAWALARLPQPTA